MIISSLCKENRYVSIRSANRILGAALAILGCHTVAHAQSSVTLYGIIDTGLLYTNNYAGSARTAISTMQTSSKYGLQGSEDIGGKMKIIFDLEGGFNPGTGALSSAGLMFAKRTYIGLSSPYGTLTVGRQYSAMLDWVHWFSVNQIFAGGIPGLYVNDVDDVGGDMHFNNTIKYKSPDFNGVSFGGQYTLGGQAGNFSTDSAWGAGAAYAGSVFGAGVAYQHIQNPSTYTAYPNTATYTNVFWGAAVAAAQKQDIFAAGAYANWGSLTTALLYSRVTFTSPGKTILAKFNNYQIGASYSFGPAIQVGAFYIFSDQTTAGVNEHAHIQQIGLVGHYFLSKSTDLYALTSAQAVGGSLHQAQQIALQPSTTSRQFIAGVGIRKRF
ncbi:porin [Paraburkholderia sp. BL25I1N1]|uniref:porin n=1 Tax=Paraburkholderia sp. BL25I1N1 TaxID=1938804 RepID=UPI0015E5B11D|nr:porin [Paraburkholderia sp. BL25I1N1]